MSQSPCLSLSAVVLARGTAAATDRLALRAGLADTETVKPIRVIAENDLVDADPTPGMHRRRAFDVPGLWSGVVHTDPGATSGWHHHGEHETSLYVVTGLMRLEFGPGGRSVVDAGPGEFVHVPPHVVHRESNPGEETAVAVIARAGSGKPTENVEGPDDG